ncbi:MAG: GIY-YIG nuclease family protein [Leptolyngbyaceae bacterium]|nr:GIY-YIG nuclease family protein [Leptolyngbyaceae bacterium]
MPLTDTDRPTLSNLTFIPYINDEGNLPVDYAGKVGIYAIFDESQTLQFVGYSRNVLLSLKQHLIRRPAQCHWVKITTIDRPSRTLLEEIQNGWIEENGTAPVGNSTDQDIWTQPIDAKAQMTEDEHQSLEQTTIDVERTTLLKSIARRVEADINAQLGDRGLAEAIRFDPKMKEQGLLNVKP